MVAAHNLVSAERGNNREAITEVRSASPRIGFNLLLDLLASPDDGDLMEAIKSGEELVGLFSPSAQYVYPLVGGIPVLLPAGARNYDLEFRHIQEIAHSDAARADSRLSIACDNTLKRLELCRGSKSWEWEDEEHWSEVYAQAHVSGVNKNWNDRIWERQFLVERMLCDASLHSKRILDVGCGEGQNFQHLLAKHCDESSLYICIDISMSALKLNRSRNTHRYALYLLGTADRLPFRRETIDVLCLFGVLHHTQRKAATLGQNREILKKGGYVLLSEALERPFIGSRLRRMLRIVDEKASAHEERIIKADLLRELTAANGFRILASRSFYTVFCGGMKRLFRSSLLNSMLAYRWMLAIDILLARYIGWLIPYFKAGQLDALVQREK